MIKLAEQGSRKSWRSEKSWNLKQKFQGLEKSCIFFLFLLYAKCHGKGMEFEIKMLRPGIAVEFF